LFFTIISSILRYTDEIREYRGTILEPGRNSPHRDRSIEESLQLFREMKNGQFEDGTCVLRAKIDMSSPNINLRDPTLYRIKRLHHPTTGDQWCIYPMYDFAHVLSDAIEGITHSLCTLEFEGHRPLYDWIIEKVSPSGLFHKDPHRTPQQILESGREGGGRPHQYEFSRLNIQHTVLSKRKLIQLVQGGHVSGWDDPRMPTISGIRRRGYTAEILKLFCARLTVSKSDSNIDYSILEDCAREILDHTSPRVFAIEKPLKVTLTNYPSSSNSGEEEKEGDEEEYFEIENHPKQPSFGKRKIHFASTLFINQEDFFDTGIYGKFTPPKGFKRLVLGGQVRLRYAYVITCQEVVRDPVTQEVIELKCAYHPDTKFGHTPEGMKKVKGIIQWLSEKDSKPIRIHFYDRLFKSASPGSSSGDFLQDLNPNSLTVSEEAMIESSALEKEIQQNRQNGENSNSVEIDDSQRNIYQFERMGYFVLDEKNSNIKERKFIFNRVVTLKDGWKD
jgi:glutaminyl-tRNA synthetase